MRQSHKKERQSKSHDITVLKCESDKYVPFFSLSAFLMSLKQPLLLLPSADDASKR